MIDHTGINVTDLALSRKFYKPVLATLGYVVRLELGGAVGFGATARLTEMIPEETSGYPTATPSFREATLPFAREALRKWFPFTMRL